MAESGGTGGARTSPLAWCWWVVVGAGVGFALIGILTIGAPILAVALVLALVGARIPETRNRSAYLILAGAAAAPLTLAWLNRSGPGTVCHRTATETSCGEQWSPWPFLVVAVVLLGVGVHLAVGRARPGAGNGRGLLGEPDRDVRR